MMANTKGTGLSMGISGAGTKQVIHHHRHRHHHHHKWAHTYANNLANVKFCAAVNDQDFIGFDATSAIWTNWKMSLCFYQLAEPTQIWCLNPVPILPETQLEAAVH